MTPQRLLPFREFMASLVDVRFDAVSFTADRRVASDDSFRRMKDFLIQRYQGIDVVNSFMDANGQIFDCVPIHQQPALRKSQGTLPTPPTLPAAQRDRSDARESVRLLPANLSRGDRDPFGNACTCPEGSIPVRRIALEDLAKHDTLRDYFRKLPPPSGASSTAPRRASLDRRHAQAGAFVNNRGGGSSLSIHRPLVAHEKFSLSQVWFSSQSPQQTVECGWTVLPSRYGHYEPVLFIYWTADGYATTGAYDLDDEHFSQLNHRWAIGGALTNVSIIGGEQFEVEVAWLYKLGNWWLFLNTEVVGFYPASQYGSGAMAMHATTIEFGGETLRNTVWPPMGSGLYANTGFGNAAYQNRIVYYSDDDSTTPISAVLNPRAPDSACYSLSIQSLGAPWNTTIFFGGPGGVICP